MIVGDVSRWILNLDRDVPISGKVTHINGHVVLEHHILSQFIKLRNELVIV